MRMVVLLFLLAAVLFGGCSSLTLKPADFSWPVEQVLKVDAKGIAQDNRYSIAFNVKDLLYKESGDSTNVTQWSLRMIRDARGFYYITASKFKNVYVFEQRDGALGQSKAIAITEKGLAEPAFNQRPPWIQLIRQDGPALLLSADGIEEGGSK